MKQAFVDYNIMLNDVPILCDDTSSINLEAQPIDYPRSKHIEIRHHFLKDNIKKKHITIEKIPCINNTSKILAKPLDNEQFNHLRLGLGMRMLEDEEDVNVK